MLFNSVFAITLVSCFFHNLSEGLLVEKPKYALKETQIVRRSRNYILAARFGWATATNSRLHQAYRRKATQFAPSASTTAISRLFIRLNVDTNECDFCGRKSCTRPIAAPLDEVFDFMFVAIDREYDQAANALGWESAAVGWFS